MGAVIGGDGSGGRLFGRCPALGWESGGRTLAGSGLLPSALLSPARPPLLRAPAQGRWVKNRPPRPEAPTASLATVTTTHRPGGGARSPRIVSASHTTSPATTPAAAGLPAPDRTAARA